MYEETYANSTNWKSFNLDTHSAPKSSISLVFKKRGPYSKENKTTERFAVCPVLNRKIAFIFCGSVKCKTDKPEH